MTVYHILAGTQRYRRSSPSRPTAFYIWTTPRRVPEGSPAVLVNTTRAPRIPCNDGRGPLRHAFQTHTYKHTTIGFLRDIEDMPNQFAYSRQFFDHYYRPTTSFARGGDVKADQVMPLIEQHYSAWNAGPRGPWFQASRRRPASNAQPCLEG